MTLHLRNRKDGTLTIEGDPPSEHYFSADHLQRLIESGAATASIVLHTGDGDVTYALRAFADEAGNRNPTSLRSELVGAAKRKKGDR